MRQALGVNDTLQFVPRRRTLLRLKGLHSGIRAFGDSGIRVFGHSEFSYLISNPRIVPVLVAKWSVSIPRRWSIETNRFGSG